MGVQNPERPLSAKDVQKLRAVLAAISTKTDTSLSLLNDIKINTSTGTKTHEEQAKQSKETNKNVLI